MKKILGTITILFLLVITPISTFFVAEKGFFSSEVNDTQLDNENTESKNLRSDEEDVNDVSLTLLDDVAISQDGAIFNLVILDNDTSDDKEKPADAINVVYIEISTDITFEDESQKIGPDQPVNLKPVGQVDESGDELEWEDSDWGFFSTDYVDLSSIWGDNFDPDEQYYARASWTEKEKPNDEIFYSKEVEFQTPNVLTPSIEWSMPYKGVHQDKVSMSIIFDESSAEYIYANNYDKNDIYSDANIYVKDENDVLTDAFTLNLLTNSDLGSDTGNYEITTNKDEYTWTIDFWVSDLPANSSESDGNAYTANFSYQYSQNAMQNNSTGTESYSLNTKDYQSVDPTSNVDITFNTDDNNTNYWTEAMASITIGDPSNTDAWSFGDESSYPSFYEYNSWNMIDSVTLDVFEDDIDNEDSTPIFTETTSWGSMSPNTPYDITIDDLTPNKKYDYELSITWLNTSPFDPTNKTEVINTGTFDTKSSISSPSLNIIESNTPTFDNSNPINYFDSYEIILGFESGANWNLSDDVNSIKYIGNIADGNDALSWEVYEKSDVEESNIIDSHNEDPVNTLGADGLGGTPITISNLKPGNNYTFKAELRLSDDAKLIYDTETLTVEQDFQTNKSLDAAYISNVTFDEQTTGDVADFEQVNLSFDINSGENWEFSDISNISFIDSNGTNIINIADFLEKNISLTLIDEGEIDDDISLDASNLSVSEDNQTLTVSNVMVESLNPSTVYSYKILIPFKESASNIGQTIFGTQSDVEGLSYGDDNDTFDSKDKIKEPSIEMIDDGNNQITDVEPEDWTTDQLSWRVNSNDDYYTIEGDSHNNANGHESEWKTSDIFKSYSLTYYDVENPDEVQQPVNIGFDEDLNQYIVDLDGLDTDTQYEYEIKMDYTNEFSDVFYDVDGYSDGITYTGSFKTIDSLSEPEINIINDGNFTGEEGNETDDWTTTDLTWEVNSTDSNIDIKNTTVTDESAWDPTKIFENFSLEYYDINNPDDIEPAVVNSPSDEENYVYESHLKDLSAETTYNYEITMDYSDEYSHIFNDNDNYENGIIYNGTFDTLEKIDEPNVYISDLSYITDENGDFYEEYNTTDSSWTQVQLNLNIDNPTNNSWTFEDDGIYSLNTMFSDPYLSNLTVDGSDENIASTADFNLSSPLEVGSNNITIKNLEPATKYYYEITLPNISDDQNIYEFGDIVLTGEFETLDKKASIGGNFSIPEITYTDETINYYSSVSGDLTLTDSNKTINEKNVNTTSQDIKDVNFELENIDTGNIVDEEDYVLTYDKDSTGYIYSYTIDGLEPSTSYELSAYASTYDNVKNNEPIDTVIFSTNESNAPTINKDNTISTVDGSTYNLNLEINNFDKLNVEDTTPIMEIKFKYYEDSSYKNLDLFYNEEYNDSFTITKQMLEANGAVDSNGTLNTQLEFKGLPTNTETQIETEIDLNYAGYQDVLFIYDRTSTTNQLIDPNSLETISREQDNDYYYYELAYDSDIYIDNLQSRISFTTKTSKLSSNELDIEEETKLTVLDYNDENDANEINSNFDSYNESNMYIRVQENELNYNEISDSKNLEFLTDRYIYVDTSDYKTLSDGEYELYYIQDFIITPEKIAAWIISLYVIIPILIIILVILLILAYLRKDRRYRAVEKQSEVLYRKIINQVNNLAWTEKYDEYIQMTTWSDKKLNEYAKELGVPIDENIPTEEKVEILSFLNKSEIERAKEFVEIDVELDNKLSEENIKEIENKITNKSILNVLWIENRINDLNTKILKYKNRKNKDFVNYEYMSNSSIKNSKEKEGDSNE